MLMGDRAAVPWPQRSAPQLCVRQPRPSWSAPPCLYLRRVRARALQAKSPSVYDFRGSGPLERSKQPQSRISDQEMTPRRRGPFRTEQMDSQTGLACSVQAKGPPKWGPGHPRRPSKEGGGARNVPASGEITSRSLAVSQRPWGDQDLPTTKRQKERPGPPGRPRGRSSSQPFPTARGRGWPESGHKIPGLYRRDQKGIKRHRGETDTQT